MSLKEAFGLPPVIVAKRHVEYDGKEHFFRELPAIDIEHFYDVFDKDGKRDAAKSKGLDYRILAACVVDEAGAPIGTAQEMEQLPARLKVELTNIAMDVNGLKTKPEDPAKN